MNLVDMKRVRRDYDIEGSLYFLVSTNGRAACRVCGDKIAKGDAVEFYYNFTENLDNSWKATACKAHVDCFPADMIAGDSRDLGILKPITKD